MDYDGKRVKRVSQQMAGRHGHLRCGNNANKTAYMAWEQDESVFIENNRGEPVIGLELDKGEPMDEDMIRAAEADEAAGGYESLA